MDFGLTEFAFQISKFSQTCIFFHGEPQNITSYRYMKYMLSPPVACISEHTKMATGKRKNTSTDLSKKLSRKNNIFRNYLHCKSSSVEISTQLVIAYLHKPQFRQDYWKEFALLHLDHASGNYLKRTSIRSPEAEKVCTKRHVISILQASLYISLI